MRKGRNKVLKNIEGWKYHCKKGHDHFGAAVYQKTFSGLPIEVTSRASKELEIAEPPSINGGQEPAGPAPGSGLLI